MMSPSLRGSDPYPCGSLTYRTVCSLVYARKEVTNPTRIVTSTVRVTGGELPVVSVKTASDIPKEKIRACVLALKSIRVAAPVSIGDVVAENVAGTGVSIVATRNVKTA